MEHWRSSLRSYKYPAKDNEVVLSGWPIYVLSSSSWFIDTQLPPDGAVACMAADSFKGSRISWGFYTAKLFSWAWEQYFDGVLVCRHCSGSHVSILESREEPLDCRCKAIADVSGGLQRYPGYLGACGWWLYWWFVFVPGYLVESHERCIERHNTTMCTILSMSCSQLRNLKESNHSSLRFSCAESRFWMQLIVLTVFFSFPCLVKNNNPS